MGLNFNYNFPTLLEGKTLSNYSLNLGVKYTMFHNKLLTSLNIYNLFRSDMLRDRITTQNITQSYNQYYDTQSVRLSISYKLGNKTLKVEEREGSNAEEKARTGN